MGNAIYFELTIGGFTRNEYSAELWLQDYIDVGTDFGALTRDQTAALVEVTLDDEGKQVKFRLADKRAALVDIAKHLGMFTDKVVVSGVIGLERWDMLTDTEKQQRVAGELIQLMAIEKAEEVA